MDTKGHVNNTLHFRFMEIARLDWIFQLGFGTPRQGQGPLMINGFCSFLKQLEFPGDGARLVWTDYAAKKSVPLPDAFRQLL